MAFLVSPPGDVGAAKRDRGAGVLVGYARTRGLPEADAEDVAQQCVQAVVEQIAAYAHAGSFRTWLRENAELVDMSGRTPQSVAEQLLP